MAKLKTIGGVELTQMFAAATEWLGKSTADIDALNVFPVPDGDCGTNMFLTMRSSIQEAERGREKKIAAVAEAVARGALMGARGNSGVILSQFFRGLAKSMDAKERINGGELAEALVYAAETAYQALSKPVEGTILTVAKDAASAAEREAQGAEADVISVLQAALGAARESVANTPRLLPQLRRAGVVDAGGQGLYTLLEGALLYLRGEAGQLKSRKSRVIASLVPKERMAVGAGAAETSFGYCTQFILQAHGLASDNLKAKLKDKGESLIVVGDDSNFRVHIHTREPEKVLDYVASLGDLSDVNVRNMDEQHREYLARQEQTSKDIAPAVVAVAAGDGLADVFLSLGASEVIPGGQTMNPSTGDILQAVEIVPSDTVFVLPNNKNIVPAARQVPALTRKKVKVIPTETIPQGIAALMAIYAEGDAGAKAEAMVKAASAVRSIEITRATRATTVSELRIKQGQFIGLLDGDLLASGNKPDKVVIDLLKRVDLAAAELVTIYYGADIKPGDAEKFGKAIQKHCPKLKVEVVRGDQPHYHYIISVE
jgi:DAK2 domain fusion protein YloV